MTKVNGIVSKGEPFELTVACMPPINGESTKSEQLTFLACERIVQREQLELKGLLRNDENLKNWTGGQNINPLKLALNSLVNPLTKFLKEEDGGYAVSELHSTVGALMEMAKTKTVDSDLVFDLIEYFNSLYHGVHLNYVLEAIDCCVGNKEVRERRIWNYENMKSPATV